MCAYVRVCMCMCMCMCVVCVCVCLCVCAEKKKKEWLNKCDLLLTEWNKNPGMYCDKFWSGWDKILTNEIKTKYKIVDIGE